MQNIWCKLSRMAAAIIVLMTVCANIAWAGGRWKVGDAVVCFGSGTCKVVRPTTSPNTTLLDTIGDGTTFTPPGPVTNPGDTRGVAINNSLHLLVTDAGTGNNQANVVEYQIAGTDPLGNSVSHGVATVFNSSGVGGIQAVALDNAGNMFILNANGSSPQIVKLNQSGTAQGTISLSTQCGISQVVGMDLSADGSFAYVTSGGTIQRVTLSSGSCSKFADFGSGVNLFGIKDIPPSALPTTCNVTATCPTGEAILVVAKGSVDIDSGETNENPGSDADSDAVNICTNATGGTAESCALLLSTATSTPALSGAVWQAGNPYGAGEVGNTTILDAFLHGETVFSPGKSGSDEPAWTHTLNAVVRDNAVVWTNRGGWMGLTTYTQNAKVGDTNQHLWQATSVSGASGPVTPPFTSNENSSFTDGLVWTDTGSPTCPAGFSSCSDDWLPNTKYCFSTDNPACQHEPVFRDTATQEVWVATPPAVGATAGGMSGGSRPLFYTGAAPNSPKADNAVVWTDQGLQSWTPNNLYNSTGVTVVDPSGKVQEVTTTGMSGPAAAGGPPFTPFLGWTETTGGLTTDGLQWKDQGMSASVIARYRITNPTTQTSLQALALNPLIRDCTVANNCSSSLPSPKVSSFWMADSISGNFFNVDFATGTSTNFSTTPSCTGCGIQGIGIYGSEDAAQPDLTQLPSVLLTTTSTTTTNTATFTFDPSSENSQITITGYNFPTNFPSSGTFPLTVYASGINLHSGFSDILSIPAPPPSPPTMAPPAPCTPFPTSAGNCVVWQIDNNDLPGTSPCTTNNCSFLWVAFSAPSGTDPNNLRDVLDEQYDATYSVDGLPKRACQVSLHTVTPAVQGAGNCTYGSPLSPNTSSPPACFTNRNNIPFKFTCTNLPTGTTIANLLPFLRVVQFVPFNSSNQEPFLFLQGTGGTTNYRFDTTKQQWLFNFNNPGFGFTPKTSPAQYQACTTDASGTVETFCTNFNVKSSCP